MKAADLLQDFISKNNISLSLSTPEPVKASDGTWVIKAPTLVVSYTKEDGQPNTTTGGDSSGDGEEKPRSDNGSQPAQ